MTDFQLYEQHRIKLSGLLKLNLHDTQDFLDTWAEMEKIKNRNGGMPPCATLRVSGEHVSQLDRNIKVNLYRKDEVDGLEVALVCCESGHGFCFRPMASHRLDNWTPTIFTAFQAQWRIKESWYPASSFWVEEVES